MAIVVLGLGRWKLIKSRVAQVAAAVNEAKPGALLRLKFPMSRAGGDETF
jgi:hypothetical protein